MSRPISVFCQKFFQFLSRNAAFFNSLLIGEVNFPDNLPNPETVQRPVGQHCGPDMFVAEILAHGLDFLRIAAVFHGQTHSRMAEGMGMIVLQTCLG